jgi:hypothetical protein
MNKRGRSSPPGKDVEESAHRHLPKAADKESLNKATSAPRRALQNLRPKSQGEAEGLSSEVP